jgi:DNA repair protein RecN (Recombination protein N)
MLIDLLIKDFAIIDSLHLSFQDGLTILSGETGAGKSIIVGALNLLLGGRASAELIRTAQEEAVVEAVFDITNAPEVKKYLQEWGIATDDEQILMRRVIAKSGKNKIFINERLATMQMLAQLSGALIDISGQFSQQQLLQNERHLDIIDLYGGLMPDRTAYEENFISCSEKLRELTALLEMEKTKEQRRELLSFQHQEIETAQLSAEEEDKLLRERIILANAEKLYEKTYGVYAGLYEDESALLGILKKSGATIEEAAAIDAQLDPIRETIKNITLQLEDAALSLRAYADKIPVDPGKLEQVENRISEVQRLKKKYGSTVEEILRYQQEIVIELKTIESSAQRIEELREEVQAQTKQLWQTAEELSHMREKAAKRLKKSIEAELATIGMKKTAFLTVIQKAPRPSQDDAACGLENLDARGMDTVEFHIAPNVGEEPRPLSKIASGGELSRIVLALKKILAVNYRVGTLLFDEVDAGIGGAVAESVGEKLKEIAMTHQVLCITHLPQIACFGATHFSVRKSVKQGRTITEVKQLNREERVEEVSRMLGGKQLSDKTKAHAQEMLRVAGKT